MQRTAYFGYTSAADPRRNISNDASVRLHGGSSAAILASLRKPPTPDAGAPGEGFHDARAEVAAAGATKPPLAARGHPVLDRPVADDVREFEEVSARVDALLRETPVKARARGLLEEEARKHAEKIRAEHAVWTSAVYEPAKKALETAVDAGFVSGRLAARTTALATMRESGSAAWMRPPPSPLRVPLPFKDGGDPLKRSLARHAEERGILGGSSSGGHREGAGAEGGERTPGRARSTLRKGTGSGGMPRAASTGATRASLGGSGFGGGPVAPPSPARTTAAGVIQALPAASLRETVPPSTWVYEGEKLALLTTSVEGRRDKNADVVRFDHFSGRESLSLTGTGRFLEVDAEFPRGKRVDVAARTRPSPIC